MRGDQIYDAATRLQPGEAVFIGAVRVRKDEDGGFEVYSNLDAKLHETTGSIDVAVNLIESWNGWW